MVLLVLFVNEVMSIFVILNICILPKTTVVTMEKKLAVFKEKSFFYWGEYWNIEVSSFYLVDCLIGQKH